jgi:hypothetical protein
MKHRDLLHKRAERGRHRNAQGQIWLLMGGGFHGLRWPAVDGLLLSAWIVDPMARCHNLAAPETTIDAIGKWGLLLLIATGKAVQDLCRTCTARRRAHQSVGAGLVGFLHVKETPYYRSSTLTMKMPLGTISIQEK